LSRILSWTTSWRGKHRMRVEDSVDSVDCGNRMPIVEAHWDPSSRKPDVAPWLLGHAPASASRSSLRIPKINRVSMANAPAVHITASTTAARRWVMSHTGQRWHRAVRPIPKCGAHSLSTIAATGTKEVNTLTSHIQHFVVVRALLVLTAPCRVKVGT